MERGWRRLAEQRRHGQRAFGGNHMVNYNSIAGWNAAGERRGDDHHTTTRRRLTGTYVAQMGNLTITLLPAAPPRARSGAWTAAPGRTAAPLVTGLLAGSHTVDYQPITSWPQPPSESVTIVNNLTTTLTRTYIADVTAPAVSSESPAPGDVDGQPLRLDQTAHHRRRFGRGFDHGADHGQPRRRYDDRDDLRREPHGHRRRRRALIMTLRPTPTFTGRTYIAGTRRGLCVPLRALARPSTTRRR